MFTLGLNKGSLSTGDNVHILTDSRGKTYLGFLFREDGELRARYLKKSDFGTPSGSVYSNVSSFFKYTVSIDSTIVDALTGSDEPEGVALIWQGGKVATLIPTITNLNYVPKKSSAIDSITLSSINTDGGSGGGSGTKKAFTVKANADGTVTVSDIQSGDLIAIDGGTSVTATDTSYTSATLKDASHTVVVTAKGSAYYYDPSSVTVTTKIALLSAPLDFVKENPLITGAVVLALILAWIYIINPMIKGEPVLGGMMDAKSSKMSSLKKKRRSLSLAA